MKNLIFVQFFAFFLCTSHFSSAQTLSWAKKIGDNTFDRGYGITTDNAGNVYTTGWFSGTVDFDPNAGVFSLTAAGIWDIFILKLDPNGNFIWAKQIGSSGLDAGYDIAADNNGNIYVSGYFEGTVNFGSATVPATLSSAGGSDAFICKFDANGTLIWGKNFGGTLADIAYGIDTDNNGNVYSTGVFLGAADFDPSPTNTAILNATSPLAGDVFVSKLDPNGNYVWAKSWGGNATDEGLGITVDNAGNTYTTGVFRGTADFDPGQNTTMLSSNGNQDLFVNALDASGNFRWAVSAGGTGEDIGHSVDISPAGNVAITGAFSNSSDFDPNPNNAVILNSAGNTDIFLWRLSANGNYLDAKRMGGTGEDAATGIVATTNGNLYLSGYFEGAANFNTLNGLSTLNSFGGKDIFLAECNAMGNLVWAKQMGGGALDEARAITADNAGTIHLTGYFEGTADFDPNQGTFTLTSAGSRDVFIAKLSSCQASSATLDISVCDSYTTPSGDTTYTSSGVYPDTLLNAAGCDSIITIYLTINTVDTGVTVNTPTISSNATGAGYQWLNCDAGFVPVNGALSQSFTPTMSGNYAVVVTQFGCTDTSTCINITLTNLEREEEISAAITAFPNPTDGKVHLVLPSMLKIREIRIYNATGQFISSDFPTSGTAAFPITLAGPKGMYWLEITTTVGEKIRLKVLKK